MRIINGIIERTGQNRSRHTREQASSLLSASDPLPLSTADIIPLRAREMGRSRVNLLPNGGKNARTLGRTVLGGGRPGHVTRGTLTNSRQQLRTLTRTIIPSTTPCQATGSNRRSTPPREL